ncbi:MAG: hypothetical protein D8M28_10295 [Proteobacteria bacterium]|nr:hypothetical protein [Pseudomonadota bacterium]
MVFKYVLPPRIGPQSGSRGYPKFNNNKNCISAGGSTYFFSRPVCSGLKILQFLRKHEFYRITLHKSPVFFTDMRGFGREMFFLSFSDIMR